MSDYLFQSQININFPMVVVTRHYGGAAVKRFNQDLAQLIMEMEATHRASTSHTSVQGGYHTDPDFLDQSNPVIREYKNEILIPGIQEYLAQYYSFMGIPAEQASANNLLVRGWGNIMRKGEWNEPHNHVTAHNRISSVYYIRVPECKFPEGALQFDNPNQISTLHGSYGAVKFQPVEGDLIMFPCFQRHYSRPFSSPGERILIANDIRVNDQFDVVMDNNTYDISIRSNRGDLD